MSEDPRKKIQEIKAIIPIIIQEVNLSTQILDSDQTLIDLMQATLKVQDREIDLLKKTKIKYRQKK